MTAPALSHDAPTNQLPGVKAASHIVSVGALAVDGEGSVITSVGLGSCIAVCAWDPARRIGGMLHFMLPTSSLDPARAARQPAMFGDTGLAALIADLGRRGSKVADADFTIIGGASMQTGVSAFDVGRRNTLAARKLLWKHRARLVAEEVGGHIARTAILEVRTGSVTVRAAGQPPRKIR